MKKKLLPQYCVSNESWGLVWGMFMHFLRHVSHLGSSPAPPSPNLTFVSFPLHIE